jgi:hypothetical protein
VNDTTAGAWGKAVRLQTSDDKPDLLAGVTQVSVNDNANANVDPAGGSCDDKSGCNSTRFTTAGITGTAPSQPGIYKTTWQLVDDGRAAFGPTMWLSFDVVDCPSDAGAHDAGTDAGSVTSHDNDGGTGDDGSSGGCSLSHPARTSGSSVAVCVLVLLAALRRRRLTRT